MSFFASTVEEYEAQCSRQFSWMKSGFLFKFVQTGHIDENNEADLARLYAWQSSRYEHVTVQQSLLTFPNVWISIDDPKTAAEFKLTFC